MDWFLNDKEFHHERGKLVIMETSIHNSSKTNIHCCPTIMEEKLLESSFFKFYNE